MKSTSTALRHFAVLTGAALFITPLMASDPIRGIMEHAKNIQTASSEMSKDLRAKKIAAGDVKQRLDAASQDLAKLKEFAAEFESANPVLTGRDKADWDLLKSKIQLLEIFHGRKNELASSGDFHKQRSLLRAHADGVALRAAKLQETAQRLSRSIPTAAGS